MWYFVKFEISSQSSEDAEAKFHTQIFYKCAGVKIWKNVVLVWNIWQIWNRIWQMWKDFTNVKKDLTNKISQAPHFSPCRQLIYTGLWNHNLYFAMFAIITCIWNNVLNHNLYLHWSLKSILIYEIICAYFLLTFEITTFIWNIIGNHNTWTVFWDKDGLDQEGSKKRQTNRHPQKSF